MAVKDLMPEGFSDEMGIFARWTLEPRCSAQGMWRGEYAIWLDIACAGKTLIGHGQPEEALKEAIAKLDELKRQAELSLRDLRAAQVSR